MRARRPERNKLIKRIFEPTYGFNGFVLYSPRENLPYMVYINCTALGHTEYDLRLVAKLMDQRSAETVLDGVFNLYKPKHKQVATKYFSNNRFTLKAKKSELSPLDSSSAATEQKTSHL